MAKKQRKPILVVKNIGIEGPGTLGTYFAARGWTIREITLRGKGRTLPADPSAFAAIFCMGGPMNVYEETKYPFLKDEDKFIREAVNARIPFVGICLGGQLLAKALGARVGKAPQPEIGWSSVALTPYARTDPLFAGCGKKMEVFEWHGDAFEIPKESVPLALGGGCNQAFRAGENAYGLQFHIEITSAMIGSWVRHYVKKSDRQAMRDAILSAMADKKELFDRQRDLIYSNLSRIL